MITFLPSKHEAGVQSPLPQWTYKFFEVSKEFSAISYILETEKSTRHIQNEVGLERLFALVEYLLLILQALSPSSKPNLNALFIRAILPPILILAHTDAGSYGSSWSNYLHHHNVHILSIFALESKCPEGLVMDLTPASSRTVPHGVYWMNSSSLWGKQNSSHFAHQNKWLREGQVVRKCEVRSSLWV